ncbi:MAG: GNAT family N-acetyltransferase [Desulfurococcales archaeon]|nr:GNAT family N-acetyltransferase [Desulfurococcales archaeon]
MARLIVDYNGRGLEGEIARLHNSLARAYGRECLSEPLDPSLVRYWFDDPEYEPEMFAAVETDSGGLAGYSWVWVNVDEGPAPLSWVNVSLDPGLPWSEMRKVAYILLSWARHSLESWQEARGVVELRLGPMGNPIQKVVYSVAGCGREGEKVGGYLMLSPEGGVEAGVPPGYVISEARPDRSKDDARRLVEVFNDAFSIYEDYWPWRLERAVEYYRELFKRREAIVLLARDRAGRPAGFIEAYIHPTLCGDKAGYISLVAVKREHQGRGLGSSLLSKAEKWLKSRGASSTYLYAIPRSSTLYLKLGYKIIETSIKTRIPTYCLPQTPTSGLKPWT